MPLFDTSANLTLASVLGPASNFRCNEFGHLCDGAPPSRLAPGGDVSATQAYDNCVSAEGSAHLLTVADTAARIKALKPDPDNQIIVAGDQRSGDAVRRALEGAAVNDTGPWPEISHSCTAADGSFADPSVRTSQLVREFGANGLLLPICDDDFAPALLAHRRQDHRPPEQALHRRHRREAAGHHQRRLHGRQHIGQHRFQRVRS